VRVKVEGVVLPAAAGLRLVSLDVFRGITMAGMTIVNNPGTWSAMYWPLDHAEWNGWTPTDLIFPFFLFIVGVSMTLSRQTLGAPWWRLVRRALVIIGLGAFMAGFPYFNPAHWRIPGVLVRIGLCYLVAAFAFRWTANRRQAVVLSALFVALLVGYWYVLTRFGDLTPAGNIGARIDRALMGGHLWRRDWDPEGLLSSAPAVATTILGALAGLWIQSSATPMRKVVGLAAGGVMLFGAGLLWGASFPINKQLWTSSYVLLTGGAAAIGLAACIYFADIRGVTTWTRPFVVLGSNAIALFVVSGLVAKLLIIIKVPSGSDGARVSLQSALYQRGFAWMGSPVNTSLIYALVFLAFMYGICYELYRRRIFLKA
jgi:predicted acyltransferase